MRTPLSLAVLAIVVADTNAQTTVDVTTVTPFGVTVGSTSFASLGANTIVTQPVTLPASIFLTESAQLAIDFPAGQHPAFTISSSLFLQWWGHSAPFPISAGTTQATSAGSTLGPVVVIGRFHTVPGATGRIEVECTMNMFAGPVINTALVDVGADGSIEVATPTAAPVPVPVVADANGTLRVRVTVDNHHGPTLSSVVSSNQVTVRFVRDPVCSITPFGTSCQGAVSSGTEAVVGATRTLTLTLSGGYPNSVVGSVFGAQISGPTLPGGCALLNNASIVMLLVADAAGQVQHQVTLPTAALGTVCHQFLPVDLATWTFRASNGLVITCSP